MKCNLTINQKPLSDYGVYFDYSEGFKTPEREYNAYSVIGRNGDLLISKERYKNNHIELECYIESNFVQNYANLINYLHTLDGYCRLEVSNEPDVYMMACLEGEIEPKAYNNDFGEFTLKFNCKPQKYLKSGEIAIPITTNTLYNSTSQIAKPLIEVAGTGTINFNSSILVLANNTSTTFIDCEIQDCYEGIINRNPDLTITGAFPVLAIGENSISATGFSSVKLYPRWWRL